MNCLKANLKEGFMNDLVGMQLCYNSLNYNSLQDIVVLVITLLLNDKGY